MNYKRITKVIKEVTGLNVPVYFNDSEAKYSGSPYFGLGEQSLEIIDDELFNNPMFELVDFIENKHLIYYHVGLPDKIFEKGDEYLVKITEEQFKKQGITVSLTEELLETFVILHEFGHAHQLLVKYQGNVEKYLADTREETDYISYQIRSNGLGGKEEGLRLHKTASTEQYADNFAIQHFQEVVKKAKKRNIYSLERKIDYKAV